MIYVLDTDHISLIKRKQLPEFSAIQAQFTAHANDEILFSVVSFHEQVLGAHAFIAKARTSKDLVKGYRLLQDTLDTYDPASILPMTFAATAMLDQLIANRVRIKPMDLRIAAIALSIGGKVVTRNARDFSRVPNLQFEDWTR